MYNDENLGLTLDIGNLSINEIRLNDIQKILDENPAINIIDVRQDHIELNLSSIPTEDFPNDSASNISIDLSGTTLSYCIFTLANALRDNHTITEFHANNNSLGDSPIEEIADMLAANENITVVELKGNQIREAGAASIANAIKINRTITTLNLNDNRLEDNGTRHIADALTVNETLTDLNLGGNSLLYDGVQALCEGLIKNKGLRRLNISGNNISNDGLKLIAETLEKNPSITSLNLRDNNIDDEGAPVIAHMINSNLTLTSLTFSENRITSEGAAIIIQALEKNVNIISFCLEDSSFFPGDEESKETIAIKKIISRNIEIIQEKDPIQKLNLMRKSQLDSKDFPSLAEVTRFKLSTAFFANEKKSALLNDPHKTNDEVARGLWGLKQEEEKLAAMKKEDSTVAPD